MGDEQGGLAPGHPAVLPVDVLLGDGVQGGGGLVQHQDGPVLVQGPGQHQPLGLAAGQLHAVLKDLAADGGGHPLGQGHDLFRQTGLVQAGHDPAGVNALHPLGHVFRHAGLQHGEVLKHGGEQLIIGTAVIAADVLPVEEHPALGGVQKAADQPHQGGLAGTVEAHNGQLFSGMNGQIDVVKGVLLRLGVAEGHILQTDLAGGGQVPGQRLPVFKPEQLRVLPIFPHRGEVQALPVELVEHVQDAGDPLGEAAGGGEVEQELRRAHAAGQGEPQEVGVGCAVADEGQQQVGQVDPQVHRLPPAEKGPEQGHGLAPHVVYPGPQAEHADVLGVGAAGGGLADIAHLLDGPGGLLPVPVAPPADLLVHKIPHRGGDGDDAEQDGVQAGENGQVGGKAQQVGEDGGPGGPDVLGGVVIAAAGIHGLVLQFGEPGVHQVGVGGPGSLQAQLAGQPHADMDPAEQGVGVQIPLQAGQEQQEQGKSGDGEKQGLQGRGLLHPGNHRRGNEQLGHGLGGGDHRQRDAQENHAGAAAPGGGEHEAGVLPHVVGGFLLLFHVGHLWYHSTKKIVPRSFWGRIVTPGGRIAALTPGGAESRW